jgi:hypothetical protein
MSKRVALRFEGFSFGLIRIDGTTYEHDVVTGGISASATRSRPKSSATPLDIHRFHSKKIYPGSATGS